MVPVNIDLPEGFLDEEENCGYKISKQMKEVWAIELEMLSEVDRICKKYGIKYFADSGTLIGAIRHKGYIPWDDDIDLVMLRDDYEKFLEVAQSELPSKIFLQTTYSDVGYIRGHAQMRRSDTTGFIESDRNRKFNKGLFVDIFVADNIPDNPAERQKFIKKIKTWWDILTRYYRPFRENDSIKGKIKGVFSKVLYTFVDYKKVFRYYEGICSKYRNCDTQELSYIQYSLGKEKHFWKREWFAESNYVPFEFMEIPVPNGYDERLKKEYGEYMVIKNVPTTHGGITIDTNISYIEYLKKSEELK